MALYMAGGNFFCRTTRHLSPLVTSTIATGLTFKANQEKKTQNVIIFLIYTWTKPIKRIYKAPYVEPQSALQKTQSNIPNEQWGKNNKANNKNTRTQEVKNTED